MNVVVSQFLNLHTVSTLLICFGKFLLLVFMANVAKEICQMSKEKA